MTAPLALADETSVRLAVTVLVLAALVVYLRGVGQVTSRLADRLGDVAVETIEAVAVVAGVAGSSWLIVLVWGASARLGTALSALDADSSLVVTTGVVVVATYAVSWATKRAVNRLADRTTLVTDHSRAVARRLVQVAVYVLGVLLILALWRVDIRNLLLGAGVVGVVLGLAARQTLGAALAGLVVLFTRPFEIGDWIEIDGTQGLVQDVTLVNTRIRTFDDESVVFPNDIVTGTKVTNRSRMGQLRIEVEVPVAYGADVEAAADAAADAMADLDVLLDSPAPRSVADGFDDSGVLLRCRGWIGDPSARRYWRARTALVAAVHDRLGAEDIEIPVPRRDLSGSVDVQGTPDSARDGESE